MELSSVLAFLATLLGSGVIGGITGLYLARSQNRKTLAEARKVIAEAEQIEIGSADQIREVAGKLIDDMQRQHEAEIQAVEARWRAQMDSVVTRLRTLEDQNRDYRHGILLLMDQITKRGETPVWLPEEFQKLMTPVPASRIKKKPEPKEGLL
jgi:hypothetical protein